jgi:hypothetical protein
LVLDAGACVDDCCSGVDDGVVVVEVGCCCCCGVEEAAVGVVAVCDDAVSDVAGDGAAAGEEFTEAETCTWRGKMFSAGERSVSPRGTRIRIRKPARVTRMPKVCADSPPRIFGRREWR